MWFAFLGFTQAIFSALATVFDRKVFSRQKVSADWQTFFHRSTQAFILVVLLGIWLFQSPENIQFSGLIDWKAYALPLAVSFVFLYGSYPLRRWAYMHEKVTVLQPFATSKQAMTILFAFLFFSQERQSIISFLIALAAVVFIFLSQIQKGGKLVINKYSIALWIGMLLMTIQGFFVLDFVHRFGSVGYYALETGIVILISLCILAIRGKLPEAKDIHISWVKLVSTNAVFSFIGSIIIMSLYRNKGLVLSSLVQLLYVVFVFMFSVLILWEKPTRKDIFVATVVSLLVMSGMFLK